MTSSPRLLIPTRPELTHLGFCRYLPARPLRAWVQCYWRAYQPHLPARGFTETLYPDGGTSLTIAFNDTQQPNLRFSAEQIVNKVHFHRAIDCLGIRFHPGGAFHLLGILLNDGHHSAQIPRAIERGLHSLQQQLAAANTVELRLSLIEGWLLSQLQRQTPDTSLMATFIPDFLSSRLNVGEFAQQQAINRRQLERKFQLQIGLSPSYLKQLHRVKKARQLISAKPTAALTDIALDCGFYDQAHFIRQFQRIVGQTPGQYKTRKMSQIYNR